MSDTETKSLPKTPGQWWLPHLRDVTSQCGEDGVLEAVFQLLPGEERWCCEFGAWDGKHLSNTYNLLTNHGWHGVLIEADARKCVELRQAYANNSRVIVLNGMVGFEGDNTLDHMLLNTPIPVEFDLISIDIDGNDYHVWAALQSYTPKVVVIEFNPTIPNNIEFIQEARFNVNHGSSVRSIVDLGKKKGYELIAVTSFNAIFVRREYFISFGIENNALAVMRPYSPYETTLYQLFDGTLVLEGCTKMLWQNVEMHKESIQVMPRWLRGFPPTTGGVRGIIQKIWRVLYRAGFIT
jgi:hypothetical protein